jgi:beta-glucosidase
VEKTKRSEIAGGEFPFRDPGLPLEERARDIVARLSLEEKLGMMASRQIAVPRLGIEEFHIGGEAAHGYAAKNAPATSFPQTIGLSCSWDAELLKEIGSLVGNEARAYFRKRRGMAGLCLFAPTVDMERDPRWGRTEEAYGEDPTLSGRLSAAYVEGLQGDHPFYLKAVASPKHFYANNNEAERTSSSSSVSPRLRREYYLAAFEPAVARARSASLMTSYNAINGVPAMLHPDILAVAKGEWGMEGFVVCDGGALPLLVSDHRYCQDIAQAAALSIKAGVDNFTEDTGTVREALRSALARGLIDEAAIDASLARVFKVRIRLGLFDPPGLNPYEDIGESALWGPEPGLLALRAARESIVLLENRSAGHALGPGLPWRAASLESLAVLGPLADCAYRDWYSGSSAYRVSPFQALCARLPGVRIRLADGCDVVSLKTLDGRRIGPKSWGAHELAANRPDSEQGEKFLKTDWGWGNQTFRSLSSGGFLTADGDRIRDSAGEVWGWYVKERFALADARIASEPRAVHMRTWNGDPVGLGPGSELAVLPAEKGGSCESLVVETLHEGLSQAVEAARLCERALLFLGNNPLLVAKEEIDRPDISLPPDQERLAAAVVEANPRTVVVIVGSYPYSLGSWREKAAAVLYAPHGGQEAGNALADIILGGCGPSGRLSMTWYAGAEGLGDIKDYDIAQKGLTYLHCSRPVLYPFGHGLGYAPVEYLGMELSGESLGPGDEISVRVRLRNPGDSDVEEVVQLYACVQGSELKRPLRQLVDFRRIALPAGRVAEARLALRSRDIEAWDQASSTWFLEACSCLLAVGASSADFRLQKTIRAEGKPAPRRDPGAWRAADEFDDWEGLILSEGEGGSSCLEPRSELAGASAQAVYGRMEFKKGGECRFEALVRGKGGSALALALSGDASDKIVLKAPEDACEWTCIGATLNIHPGSHRLSIAFSGEISLQRFRFVPA